MIAVDDRGRWTGAFISRADEDRQQASDGLTTTIAARVAAGLHTLECARIRGDSGARVAPHRHRVGHEALLVLTGILDLQIDGSTVRLHAGDFASVPPEVIHSYQLRVDGTSMAAWTVGARPPHVADAHPSGNDMATDTVSCDAASSNVAPVPRTLPDAAVSYVLAHGGGEHLAAGRQVFSFLAHQRATNGRFISVATAGLTDGRIPLHFHRRHSETFLCVNGPMSMWIDDAVHRLDAGDLVHVPPGVVHAYQLHTADARFVGVLVPGLFEPFFRALCVPWSNAVPPAEPVPSRIVDLLGREDLDVSFVG